jgi:hypothetical protein
MVIFIRKKFIRISINLLYVQCTKVSFSYLCLLVAVIIKKMVTCFYILRLILSRWNGYVKLSAFCLHLVFDSFAFVTSPVDTI